MIKEIHIMRKIRHQVAYLLFRYGDEPDELMFNLEELIIDWFSKGLRYPYKISGGLMNH